MTKNQVIWVGVVSFLCLAWVCIRYRAPMIESDVETLAQARLFAEGLDSVKARAWGRRIILEGEVANQHERRLAIEKVAGLRVVGRVVDDMQIKADVAPPSTTFEKTKQEALLDQPYLLLLTYDGTTLFFEGAMPDDFTIDLFEKAAIISGFEETNFEKLEVRPDGPPNWSIAAMALVEALAQLETGEALLEKDRYQLAGTAAHAGKKRQAEVALAFLQAVFEGQSRITLDLSPNAKACQEALDQVLASHKVEFETDLATLTAAGRNAVRMLFDQIGACPEVSYQVVGRTESKGVESEELANTQNMATAVMTELVALGLDPAKITALGVGTAYPVKDAEATEDQTQPARSIEFNVLEKAP